MDRGGRIGGRMDVIKARFQDAFFEEGYMWIFDNRIQAICRINLENFEMEIVSIYLGKEKFVAEQIFSVKYKFYLVTRSSAKILVYDRKAQGEDVLFRLLEPVMERRSESYSAFYYGGYIRFFPRNIDEDVVCFEVSIEKYSRKALFDASIQKKIGNVNLFIRYPSVYKEVVWFVIYTTKYYVRYNMADENVELFEVDSDNIALDEICFDGDDLWLTELDGNRVICVSKQVIEVPGEQSYSRLYDINNNIIILPKLNNKVVLIRKKTFETAVIELPFYESKKYSSGSNILRCKKYRNFIFLFPAGISDMFILDERTLVITRVLLKCKSYIEHCFTNEKVSCREDMDINYKHLLQICESNLEHIKKSNRTNNGTKIWKQLTNNKK